MRNVVKRRVVYDFVGAQQVDICLLQEVHLRDRGDIGVFKKEWDKGESVWSVGGVHSTGVGILFGNRGVGVEETFSIVQGRVMGADISWGAVKLRVIVVYGPQTPAKRKGMFAQVEPYLVTNRQVILGGDFNVELGRGGDDSGEYISKLMANGGLVDGARGVKTQGMGPTWRNTRGTERVLDYIYITRSLRLLSGRLLPVCFSDHDGLVLEVGAGVLGFGAGYWRLNISVLEEERFGEQFRWFFGGLEGLRQMCKGIIEWWEVAKERIKGFCIRYCKRKARGERREGARLQRRLEAEYERGNMGGTVNRQVCDSLRAQLRAVSERRARGYLERARDRYMEKEERASAAFFSAVRGGRERQVVAGVRDEKGELVLDEGGMVGVVTEYYRTKYSRREVDEGGGEAFLNLVKKRVPEGMVESLEAPLTLKELEGALGRMNRRRVPGIDGLPVEFYMKFWDRLGPVLLEVLTEVFRGGGDGEVDGNRSDHPPVQEG